HLYLRAFDGTAWSQTATWDGFSVIVPLRFSHEVVGTAGFDGFQSADDTIYFGRDGNDSFNTPFSGSGTSMWMGGAGSDTYFTGGPNKFTIVYENAGSPSDNINTPWIISGPEDRDSVAAVIDGRHLLIGETSKDAYVLVIDWTQPANQIES